MSSPESGVGRRRVSLHVEVEGVHEPVMMSRTTSAASSSLDPYYFGQSSSVTPEMPQLHEPITPAKDPASIDRRGLVGVGELATPRWTKESAQETRPEEADIQEEAEAQDPPDSPWTIEAVDGELDDPQEELKEQTLPQQPLKSLRGQPSMTSESGGEEILYPRKSSEPPTSFNSQPRRARKRTSDEFEMDNQGSLVSKSKEKDRRKHHSLAASPRDPKPRDRRRDSLSSAVSSSKSVSTRDRHVRQSSTSSSSDAIPRRGLTSDYSHLPPSPSTSSIKHLLKHSSSSKSTPTSASKDPLASASSPNVAHSLLRGTQEGWSGMDDEATAEALRKLDGLTGRSARARASIGSFHRSSRPGTPAKSTSQWEGVDSAPVKHKASLKDLRSAEGFVPAIDQPSEQGLPTSITATKVVHGEEYTTPSGLDKTPRRSSVRGSINGKRASTSSTNYTGTPTTSSRDSASMSASTSATSVSAHSNRHSISKTKRNSAGSDISNSSDATSLKDRVASLAINGEPSDEHIVPPVPPLPKDLASYKSPPPSSTGVTFPSLPGNEESRPSGEQTTSESTYLQPRSSISSSQDHGSHRLTPEAASTVTKTPSKKWSFTNALKLSGSPSSSSPKREFSLSPRSVTFGAQLRKSTSKDHALSPTSPSTQEPSWPQSTAMQSAASLASFSSVGSSSRTPGSQGLSSDRTEVSSRAGTESSASNHTQSALAPSVNPSSPTSSLRRGQSKRLTPSSIPFFRRSSSQSMQLTSNSATYAGPTSPSSSSSQFPPPIEARAKEKGSTSPDPHVYATSTSVPGSATRKSSIMSLGLPSLLKGSSSRRSLHADSKDAAKETLKARESISKEKDRARVDKEKTKKDDKDRSESRISVLMGRKRGKTLSSTEPRKPRSPVSMPPMQISALEPATAQRVARLKSNASASAANASSAAKASSSSRVTSQTVSSMQKQSDASLRSTRNQLPTIAGSPSVGNANGQAKEGRDGGPPPTLNSSVSTGLPKETPTKIPRISSRTSGLSSPSMKGTAPRRSSVNASSTATTANSSANSSPTINEFGVMENGESPSKTVTTKPSTRTSPSAATTSSRIARQSTIGTSSSSVLPRKSNRDSMSFGGLRKSSTASGLSTNTTSSSTSHRFSALSPSKGLKLLSPKISLQSAKTVQSSSQSIQQSMTPSSSRQSLTTPSPSPNQVDDDERLGDEEMLAYIRRQQQKKLNAGASQAELDELLKFPEPISPTPPLSPDAVLKGSQNQYLSDYERQEILEFPNIYYIGQRSRKKMATPDNSHNNYGYDDDRGDYLVVAKDHLSYRYEVVDTLGKGSFGQVLHCRDHCTGESVAIKIIRNKKRFHHQALVEIKILDNLRKWDAEEKHHVIKMTDHFYFRNHLCIAMELLSINLYELIKANGFVGFTTNLIRRFTSQMLLSLSLMRHHRIVHCDLKPENVLLRHPSKSALKVIDFGSSCFEHEKIYTYIQSRFYRSPEVILGMNYHMAIDMWSLGCILAELYTGFPIFPGENEQEQLSCIMEVLGTPDKDFVNRSSRKKLFFDGNGAPRTVVNSKGRRRRPGTKTLAQVLRCSDEDFVDFISKCLVWDPERRIKPQAALRHPFVTAGRRPKPAPTPTKNLLSSSSLASRSKHSLQQTPRKSEIGAPTPLTARTSRTNGSGQPTTPSTSHTSTSKSFRSSQSQHSSRTLNGMAV